MGTGEKSGLLIPFLPRLAAVPPTQVQLVRNLKIVLLPALYVPLRVSARAWTSGRLAGILPGSALKSREVESAEEASPAESQNERRLLKCWSANKPCP